jgi:hypothetical protein
MQHDHEGEAVRRRHVLEKSAQGIDPAGGGANAYDPQVSAQSSFRMGLFNAASWRSLGSDATSDRRYGSRPKLAKRASISLEGARIS